MNRNYATLLAAAMILSGCAATTSNVAAPSAAAGAQSDQVALRPYYDGLITPLPKAPPGIELDAAATITRFAFGSCVNENRTMKFWDVIAAQRPQAFLLIGDNVYGDTAATGAAEMPTLTASYRKLNTRQEYARFRAAIPMLTMWDDHDFGLNDAGGSFAFKEYAEKIFEEYWDASDAVRSRPGVYDSYIFGPTGKRVQFILLDARFFRSDLARMNYRDPAPKLGDVMPNADPKATMLGTAQWDWLAAQLEQPADLRFIISSVQVITDAHNFEGWHSMPLERQKLIRMIADKKVSNAVFLSGDRHVGALYQTQVASIAKPLYEFTSTSLNFAFGNGEVGAREPDPARFTGLWAEENFGQVDIDWQTKSVKLSLKNAAGDVLEERTITPID
jgi:alkaline phosphatase D